MCRQRCAAEKPQSLSRQRAVRSCYRPRVNYSDSLKNKKEGGVSAVLQICGKGYLVCSLFLEAVTAVHRLVASRLKWNFRGAAAAAAGGAEHLALAAAVTRMIIAASAGCSACFSCLAAVGATIRFVLKALLSVKFLLATCKCKLCAAIDARQ